MASRPSRSKAAVAARLAAAAEAAIAAPSAPKGESRNFAGFGESKLHIAPEGAFDNSDRPDWSKLTVNGLPVPEHMRSLVTYQQTDQGKAEQEAAIEARGGRAVTEFARDVQDKLIDKFGDDLVNQPRKGLVQVQDPLAVLMSRHLPKGMRGRWMGPRKSAEAGLIRGVVEYEPVMIDDPENPGRKKRVEMGGMFLAAIPESLALEAEAHYQEIERENRVAVNDKVNEYNEKNVGAERLTSAASRRGKLHDLVGEQDDTERAATDLERDLAAAAAE